MANQSIESLEKEMQALKNDVAHLKRIVAEDYDLSDEAKKALVQARRTPESRYREL